MSFLTIRRGLPRRRRRGSAGIELFEDAAEIRVERVAPGFGAKERTAVFGGEDQMNADAEMLPHSAAGS